MVRQRSQILLVLLVVTLRPADLIAAQSTISGFAGLGWGTTRAELLARFGKPIEDLKDSTVERLSYVQGPDSGFLLVVAKDHGLVAAIRILPLATGSRCRATLLADSARIAQHLKGVTPQEKTTRAVSDGGCGGFSQWDVLWRDEAGDQILLSADVAKHRRYISYSSPLAPN